ncbi:uncharacterized protein LOC110448963 [Mizuhopecten yessoensis]|uniref:Protein toll n=1 Tax=Mizuhopecten yessoensis TaxID=6573 RepID=A0A210QSA2_MIZYE|nr:uncharacterized protein LOC110448963 [Mizuhopecten yessoensis]OWF51595.1 Protein toll [Mizuhopecten yessoensis]
MGRVLHRIKYPLQCSPFCDKYLGSLLVSRSDTDHSFVERCISREQFHSDITCSVNMYLTRRVLLFFIPMVVCFPYEDWTPDIGPPKDLLCNKNCTDDRCCSCFSRPTWELGLESLGNVYVEYTSLGKASAELIYYPTNSTYKRYQAIYTGQRLRSLPRNICDFKNLVKIDFTDNLIETIDEIHCLKQLDTLILAGNKIKRISNMTFMEMPDLRVLDLSNNSMKNLDANAFTGNMTNIFYVDFSNNVFETIDITNVMRENHLFCKMNFENALNGHFTNTNNITIDSDKRYNSGDISFTGCSMEEDMFSFLLKKDPHLIQYIPLMVPTGVYDLQNVTLTCDCNVALYLESNWKVITMIPTMSGLACSNQGNSTLDMNDPETYDRMICNIRINCPKFCTCIEQPTQWRIIVNCSFTEMQQMPMALPESAFLVELLMANNDVQRLEHRVYMHRLRILDLSDNGVNAIDSEVGKSLVSLSKLDLDKHNLKDLPKSFQLLDPNHVLLGDNGIECTCNNTWIGEWRERGTVHFLNPLFCENIRNGDSKTLVELAGPFLVDCDNSHINTVLTIILSTCLGLALISLTAAAVGSLFHLEIKLLLRKFRRKIVKDDGCTCKYDVFVSFDENDDDSRRFVMDYLLRILHSSNFTTFVPGRDMSVGNLWEEEIKVAVQQSRTFLCILSETYSKTESVWMRMEFKIAWKSNKAIEIINMDNVGTDDVGMSEIRAYLRLKCFISLTTRQDIFKQLIDYLGKPIKDLSDSHLDKNKE